MSALGWELPLDAILITGSFAQIVTFAKLRERYLRCDGHTAASDGPKANPALTFNLDPSSGGRLVCEGQIYSFVHAALGIRYAEPLEVKITGTH
jgi:hypothetical protein